MGHLLVILVSVGAFVWVYKDRKLNRARKLAIAVMMVANIFIGFFSIGPKDSYRTWPIVIWSLLLATCLVIGLIGRQQEKRIGAG
jgi:peptidoglycan/LPS O-acetylase OafA/YrhL